MVVFGSTVLSVLFLPWESYGALFPPKPFTAIGKSTSVHVLLVYHVCVNHLTIIVQAKKQLRDHVVSLTKKIEDKQRESERGRNTTRKPLTSPAMAASATYDPPACVPVQYTPSPHLGRRWVRLVLSLSKM